LRTFVCGAQQHVLYGRNGVGSAHTSLHVPLINGHQNVHQTLGSVLLSTTDEGRVCEEFLNPSGKMWSHLNL
jgi:Fe-S cluster assembly ATPase SufC